jgi:hypothetical protein
MIWSPLAKAGSIARGASPHLLHSNQIERQAVVGDLLCPLDVHAESAAMTRQP